MEFAGEVEAVGPLVSKWKPGQRVMGLVGGGAQAEYLVTHEGLLVEIPVITVGVVLTSAFDILNALRDLRHPLWGEARVLRTMQFLLASWSSIHFTTFGITFLRQFETLGENGDVLAFGDCGWCAAR